MDIFENTVLCKKCSKKMYRGEAVKNGFILRTLECAECGQKVYHPEDLAEYKQFSNLRNRSYKVKLRIVGNSHAVSIPKEILDFFNNTEDMENMAERMVTVALEEFNKVSLLFDEMRNGHGQGESHQEKDLIKRKNSLRKLKL